MIILILIISPIYISGSSELLWDWEKVSSKVLGNEYFTYLYGMEGTSVVYAGTREGLYRSEDLGKSWRKESLFGGKVQVTGITSLGAEVIVSSEEGLYIKLPNEKWKRVIGKKGFKGVAAPGERAESKALAWTSHELFFLEGGDLLKAGPFIQDKELLDVAFSGGGIYASYGGNLYYSFDRGKSWEKYFFAGSMIGGEELSPQDEEETFPRVRKISPEDTGGVIAATVRNIMIINPLSGVYVEVDTAGLPSRDVASAIKAGDGVFALAGRNIFFREDTGEGEWKTVFQSASKGGVTQMNIHTDDEGKSWMWIAAGRDIYKKRVDYVFNSMEVLGRVDGEIFPYEGGPSIVEVQEMAIEYAEVSPEKIKRWRALARWKAILPRLSVDFSEARDDNIEIYKSATKYYAITGPRETSNDWGIDLSWDLADLIWNDAQTSIDTRSKLMVQLRGDILEEVTRLYFERKRLIEELRTSGSEGGVNSSRRLRIEELTGYIDALTGGGFSEALGAR